MTPAGHTYMQSETDFEGLEALSENEILKYPDDVGHEDVNLLLELLVELRNFEEALEVSDVM